MRSFFRTLRVISMTGLLVILSCQNMLTGSDVTSKVKGQVSEANAQSAPITMQIDTTGGGTLVLPLNSVKVGIPFTINTQVSPGFVFNQWTWTPTNLLQVDDSKAFKTTATMLTATGSGPTLTANFYKSPTLIAITPALGTKGVFRNNPIQLQFSQDMDPASVIFSDPDPKKVNASVTETKFGSSPDTTVGSSYFSGASYDPTNKTLLTLTYKAVSPPTTPATAVQLASSAKYIISFLGGANGIKDKFGVPVQSGFSTSFDTGSTADTSAPTINHIYLAGSTTDIAALVTANGSSTTSTLFSNSGQVYIGANISSTQDIQGFRIYDSKAVDPTAPSSVGTDGSPIQFTLTTLTPGEHDLTVKAVNSFGNPSPSSDVIKVFVDKIAPTVAIDSVTYSPGSTGWAKNTDDITVHFHANDDTSGSGLVSDSSPASAVITGLQNVSIAGANGVYTATGKLNADTLAYSVSVTDRAGNTGTTTTIGSGVQQFQIDNADPVVTLGTVVTTGNAGFAKATNRIQLPFTASDTNIDVSTLTATIKGHPATSITATGVNSYLAEYIVQPGDVDTGTPAYQVTVNDLAGNTGSSSTLAGGAVMIDTMAPTVSLASATLGATTGNPAYAKAGVVVRLDNFSVTDSGSGLAASLPIVVTYNTTLGTTVTSTGTNTYKAEYTVAPGQNASVSYSITVTDKAGNSTTVNTGATGTVTMDTTVPVVTLGNLTSDNITNPLVANTAWARNGDHVTLAFTAVDANLATSTTPLTVSLAGSLVTGGGLTGSLSGSTGTYSAQATLASAASGSNVAYSVTVTDLAGNATTLTTTANQQFTIDTTPPSVTVGNLTSENDTNPGTPDPSWAKNNDKIHVLISGLGDSGSGLAASPLAVSFTGLAAVGVSGPDGSGVYDASGKLNGSSVTCSVTVTDVAGNQSTVSGPSQQFIIDTTAPVVGVGSVTFGATTGNASYARSGVVVRLDNFSVTESGSGLAASSPIVVKYNSILGTAIASTGTNTYKAEYTVQNGDNAAVTYSITARDKAGNEATVNSGATGVNFDTIAPSVTMGTLTSDNATNPGTRNTAFAKNGDTMTLNFTASDTNLATSTTPLTVSLNGSATGVTLGGTSGTYTASKVLASGISGTTVPYSVTVTDLAGNSSIVLTEGSPSPATQQFAIDTTLPVISFQNLDSDNSSNPNAPNPLWAKNNDMLTLNFKVDDANLATGTGPLTTISLASASVTGSNLTGSLAGTTGTYTAVTTLLGSTSGATIAYSVLVTDAAGNQATLTTGAHQSFKVDTAGPTGTLLSLTSANDTNPVAPNPSWAKTNDTIHLKFNAVSDPGTMFASGMATTNPVAVSFTALQNPGLSGPDGGGNYDATGTLNSTGTVAYSVTLTDLAGNQTVINSGVAAAFAVDRTLPVVNLVGSPHSLLGTTGNAGFARDTQTVTLSNILASDAGSGLLATNPVVVTFNGTTNKNATGSSGNYSASYGVTTGDNGTLTYLVTVTDKAGNQATANTGATGSIVMDTTLPVISFQNLDSDNSSNPNAPNPLWAKNNDKLTLNFKVDDANLATGTGPLTTISLASASVTGTNLTGSLAGTTGTYTAKTTLLGSTSGATIAYSVLVTDAAGNQATLTTGAHQSFNVDTAGPTGTLLSLTSDNDTNPVASDPAWAKTNDTIHLKFNAVSDPGTTFASGMATTNPVAVSFTALQNPGLSGPDGGGNYDATGTLNSTGTVAYSVTLTDLAGNQTVINSGVAAAFAVDRTLPVVNLVGSPHSLLGTTGNAGFAKDQQTVTLSNILASDAGSGLLATNPVVVTFNGTTNKNATGSSGNYSASYGVTTGDNGTVTYLVTVTDKAGNQATASTGATGSIVMDTTPPIVNLVGTPHSLLGTTGNAGFAKNTQTVTLSNILASDAGSGLLATNPVVVTFNGTTNKNATGSSGNYSASYGVTTGDNGALTYLVTVTDKAGNQATASTGATGSIVMDTTLPVISFQNLDSDNSSNPNAPNPLWAKNNDMLTLNFKVDDANLATGTGPLTTISLASASVTGSNLTGSLAGTTGTYTAVTTLLGSTSGATIAYSVLVTDAAGNQATLTTGAHQSFKVDTAGPTGTLLSLTSANDTNPVAPNPAWAKTNDTIHLKFNAVSDPGTMFASGMATTNPVAVSFTALQNPGLSGPDGGGNYDATGTLNSTGTVAYSVTLTDLAGNQTVINSGVAAAFAVDRTLPVVNLVGSPHSLLGTTGNAGFARDTQTVTLSNILASDAGSGLLATNPVVVTFNGTTNKNATGSSGNYSASYGVTTGDNGTLTYLVTVTDKAGNQATASTGATGSIVMDTSPPTIHVVSFFYQTSTDVFTNAGLTVSPTDTFDLTFNLSETPSATLGTNQVRFNNNQSSTFTSGSGAGDYVFHRIAGAGDGTIGFTIGDNADITDPAGNIAAPVIFVIGNTRPLSIAGVTGSQNSRNTVTAGGNTNTVSIAAQASIFGGQPRSWWLETPSTGLTPATAIATIQQAPVAAYAVSASLTLDRLPVLSDTSAFTSSVSKARTGRAPIDVTSSASSVASTKKNPTQTPRQTPISQSAASATSSPSVPAPTAPLPGTDKPLPRIDIYAGERRARASEEETDEAWL